MSASEKDACAWDLVHSSLPRAGTKMGPQVLGVVQKFLKIHCTSRCAFGGTRHMYARASSFAHLLRVPLSAVPLFTVSSLRPLRQIGGALLSATSSSYAERRAIARQRASRVLPARHVDRRVRKKPTRSAGRDVVFRGEKDTPGVSYRAAGSRSASALRTADDRKNFPLTTHNRLTASK